MSTKEPSVLCGEPKRTPACPTHGDPLVCLACEAEEDARPEWQGVRTDLARLTQQAVEISMALADAGIGPCPLPEGVRRLTAEVERLRTSIAAGSRSSQTRDDDSTVASIAGNIVSGFAAQWSPRVLFEDLEARRELVQVSVGLARAIVAETRRTTPAPQGAASPDRKTREE